ncbi:Pycsar system effector family protein [Winogradskyella wichelsiae]|uniref:Pycsar system effector family protein n=1 Tax=Winogradskyella wichelsiae TaxID=2697007 RepID=UPI0015CDA6F3|nr:Pycsar system effector family protein [Winogradskyella wichelsiae]
MSNKLKEKAEDKYLMDELNIDKDALKQLKKKLAKVAPRSERGVETLFRLLSKNQYTLNTMIDTKSNILISINALILSLILGTVMGQLSSDPHLIYPIIMILITNLASITFAVFATRPELVHGQSDVKNLMFYGNFQDMEEAAYVEGITNLMNEGDELYKTIAKDTYHLGKTIDRKFKLLRKSFHIFLIGIVLSVIAFVSCHVFFGGLMG